MLLNHDNSLSAPQDMKISCRGGELTLAGKYAFALQEWKYGSAVICCQEGFNGTVIANAPGKFIGVGHNEGGTEKFLDFALAVDGRACPEFRGEFSGENAIYLRKTLLENLQVQIKSTFSGSEMLNSCTFQAADEQKTALFYCHQYSWATHFDRFIFQDEKGSWENGICRSTGEMIYWGKFRCAALFSPEHQLAIAFAPDPELARISTGKLWDRHIYHKFYCELDPAETIPAGTVSPEYFMLNTVIPAAENEFCSRIQRWADDLDDYWKNLSINHK
jgi:hypothetical protein